MTETRLSYAERLKAGVRDVRDHLRGDLELTSTVVSVPARIRYAKEDVARIRTRLGISQSEFASLLGVTMKVIQSWELGVRRPSASSNRLLQILDHPSDFRMILDAAAESESRDQSKRTNALVAS
jgi:putative transcriptional regulator